MGNPGQSQLPISPLQIGRGELTQFFRESLCALCFFYVRSSCLNFYFKAFEIDIARHSIGGSFSLSRESTNLTRAKETIWSSRVRNERCQKYTDLMSAQLL